MVLPVHRAVVRAALVARTAPAIHLPHPQAAQATLDRAVREVLPVLAQATSKAVVAVVGARELVSPHMLVARPAVAVVELLDRPVPTRAALVVMARSSLRGHRTGRLLIRSLVPAL